MKFSLVPLIALAFASGTYVMALPEPAPAAAEPTTYTDPVAGRALEKRDNSGTVKVAGLNHRQCPRTSCISNGQYAIGTPLDIVCYTRDNTTVVKDDAGWAKLANGDWVALAFGKYVSWSGSIQYC